MSKQPNVPNPVRILPDAAGVVQAWHVVRDGDNSPEAQIALRFMLAKLDTAMQKHAPDALAAAGDVPDIVKNAQAAARSLAAAALGSATSPAKADAARRNAVTGARPLSACKCPDGVRNSDDYRAHDTHCPRRRALYRRELRQRAARRKRGAK